MYLSYEKWCHEGHQKEEVKSAGSVVGHLIAMIKKHLPREGGHQWRVPKIHSLLKMFHYVLRFGCAQGFYGGVGEHN